MVKDLNFWSMVQFLTSIYLSINLSVVIFQMAKSQKNSNVGLDMDFFQNSYPPFPTPGGCCCVLFSIMSRKTWVFLKDRVKYV